MSKPTHAQALKLNADLQSKLNRAENEIKRLSSLLLDKGDMQLQFEKNGELRVYADTKVNFNEFIVMWKAGETDYLEVTTILKSFSISPMSTSRFKIRIVDNEYESR